MRICTLVGHRGTLHDHKLMSKPCPLALNERPSKLPIVSNSAATPSNQQPAPEVDAFDLSNDAFDLSNVVGLTRALVDVESVSDHEGPIADLVESAVRRLDHLEVIRDGDVIIARTQLGRPERVVVAGHLDTVPVAGNVPSREQVSDDGRRLIFGRGSCDMKGGIAVQLSVAAACTEPSRDVTWVFYDHEEVAAELNGLGRIARTRPDLLNADFGVLCEPSNATIEGGCQGTLQAAVTLSGRAAHSARSWQRGTTPSTMPGRYWIGWPPTSRARLRWRVSPIVRASMRCRSAAASQAM